MLVRLNRGGTGTGDAVSGIRDGAASLHATGKPFFERIVNFSINFFGATVREPAVKSD